ncbi:acetate/propionate family kinase [bacterium]|nr:acetate/propionate family kinase [bacterium]
MFVLVLNCGSSTVKYRHFEARRGTPREIDGGIVEVEGEHEDAVAQVLASLSARVDAIGHRVVHGGSKFTRPTVIDKDVLRTIEALSPIAPLHNPPAVAGIRRARKLGVPMVAVFDTSFHATLPPVAYRYALPPLETAGETIRRFGFHGISHQYVCEEYSRRARRKRPTIVTLHLGNGASACAIKNGVSVDTSMGFSPLEGLVMGTRPGDVDAEIVLRLIRDGRSVDEVDRLLNRESGLRALGGTNDMRELLARDDDDARFAIDAFCYRAAKYVGAYHAALGGAQAVVFTAGIGERSAAIRARIVSHLKALGCVIDKRRNAKGDGRISTDGSRLAAWAIPTNEELLIARRTVETLGDQR